MLYIAEVKRQTKGFIGGTKIVLQLLACQRNDQSWSAVSGEVIPYEEGTQFGDGALVMVNLAANRQVQGQPEPAGERIVGLLQSFSRAMEKSRTQEAEIEEWKQSLTYQAQELNRREQELESSRDQVERQEEELERLEQQRQEIEASLARLEQQREQSGGTGTLDEEGGVVVGTERAGELQKLVGNLAAAVAPAAQASSQLVALQGAIAQRQAALEQQSQQLGGGADPGLATLRQQVLQEQGALEQSRRQVVTCQKELEVRQEAARRLNQQLQTLGDLQDALVRVAIDSPLVRLGQAIDTEELERLSDADLEARVATLEQDLNKVRPFVSDQEEELKLQLQSVEELQKHLEEAGSADRASIAKELEEERDRYRFLEETLLGQRRTIKVREDTLEQHQRALRCRQGEAAEARDLAASDRVDLGPLLNQLESQRNATEEDLHKLEGEFERLERDIAQARELAELRERQQDGKVRELTQAETAAAPADLSSAYEQQRALLQELAQQVNTAIGFLQQAGDARQAVSQLEAALASLGAIAAS